MLQLRRDIEGVPGGHQGASVVDLETARHRKGGELDESPSYAVASAVAALGAPVTAEGGNVTMPANLLSELVIFDQGAVWVTETSRYREEVFLVVRLAEDLGVKVHAEEDWKVVPPEDIATAYAAGRKRQRSTVQNEVQAREFIELATVVNASDLFLGYDDRGGRLQFRVNSDVTPPLRLFTREETSLLVATFHGMMDQAHGGHDPTKNQGGRIRDRAKTYGFPETVSSVRCAFNTLAEGRELAARLHYKEAEYARDFASIGFAPSQVAALVREVMRTEGMLLISGRTGSGKSTLLKIFIEAWDAYRKGRKRVATVEDPVEFLIACAKQFTVNAPLGEVRAMAWLETIAQCLRSNPDFLGAQELRDHPSANAALQFVLTGHYGASTIHSLNALTMPGRLEQMDLRRGEIYDAGALTCFVHMSLLPKLCPHCKVPLKNAVSKDPVLMNLAQRLWAIYGEWGDLDRVCVANPLGCRECLPPPAIKDLLDRLARDGAAVADFNFGVKGRTVVAEYIEPVPELMKSLKQGEMDKARSLWIGELGGTTKFDHAIALVLAGVVSPVDVELNLDRVKPLVPANLRSRHADGREHHMSAGPTAIKRLGLGDPANSNVTVGQVAGSHAHA
ncbi:ATPase, T2SS/T4P/T4SS family [Azospirillum sp. B4]|uniref:ATPase, T2SS/T4P/T4SS family n=1 Tax=Azospirillum sp. B4 TaxID=95605 RepID=UPI0003496E11|nr:ATPase, T2SS/T4P/T4SS family [Azospirillum sp. B4]